LGDARARLMYVCRAAAVEGYYSGLQEDEVEGQVRPSESRLVMIRSGRGWKWSRLGVEGRRRRGA
jgi:hypothetical protein